MITTIAIFIIAFLCMIQNRHENYLGTAAFAVSALVYDLFFYGGEGQYYYIGAMLLDLMAMWLISKIRPFTGLLVAVQALLMAQMLLNMMGWAIWWDFLDYPLSLYSNSFTTLYIAAIFIIAGKGGDNVRNRRAGDPARYGDSIPDNRPGLVHSSKRDISL